MKAKYLLLLSRTLNEPYFIFLRTTLAKKSAQSFEDPVVKLHDLELYFDKALKAYIGKGSGGTWSLLSFHRPMVGMPASDAFSFFSSTVTSKL